MQLQELRLYLEEWQSEEIKDIPEIWDEDWSFKIHILVPAPEPNLEHVVASLSTIERRLRLAMIFAYMEAEDIDKFQSLDSLLNEFHNFPIRVTELGLSSIKTKVEVNPNSARKHVNGKKRTNSKSVAKMVAFLMALSFLSGAGAVYYGEHGALPPTPTQIEVAQTIEWACGYMTPGTKITLDVKAVKIEIPCQNSEEKK